MQHEPPARTIGEAGATGHDASRATSASGAVAPDGGQVAAIDGKTELKGHRPQDVQTDR